MLELLPNINSIIYAALAFVWLIVREVAPRWNGMSLEWKINIYKSEGGA